ncbi:MAG: tRNA (adenosine(37)-N6)-threonylcarbamoyltransferase complex transferase subunit TsaD [Pseudomonadota bacterium]
MRVLGIETSCDETAAAVVQDAPDPDNRLLSNIVYDQIEAHRPYGGVVPEIAARAHVAKLPEAVRLAMDEAGLGFADLDGIAATAGPGLIGGLHVGVTLAKALAGAHAKPFLAINHLEAHALTPRLTGQVDFPFVLLLVSGGHCLLALAKGVGEYELLGTTIDDAIGEAFDKGARVLGLPYPGGPAMERAAKTGDPTAFDFPRPLKGRLGCDFSFSGLKAAIKRTVDGMNIEGDPSPHLVADLAASYQQAIADCLADRVNRCLQEVTKRSPITALVVAGGVAANQALRDRLTASAQAHSVPLQAPPARLCTDNGAMVAWAGLERLALGLEDRLDFAARPRWPLDELAQSTRFTAETKNKQRVSTG